GGDDVPCAGYAPFGSPELADIAAAALADRSACLLANHGMIAHGPDLARAVAATRRLETLARQYLLALTAGEPVILDAAEMAEVRRRYAGYGQPRARCRPPTPHRPDPGDARDRARDAQFPRHRPARAGGAGHPRRHVGAPEGDP